MRAVGLTHTPRAMLSRGICAMRSTALIINLSGSPKAVKEQLEVLLNSHDIVGYTEIPQVFGTGATGTRMGSCGSGRSRMLSTSKWTPWRPRGGCGPAR